MNKTKIGIFLSLMLVLEMCIRDRHSTQTEQKKDKYEEKEFYAHGT